MALCGTGQERLLCRELTDKKKTISKLGQIQALFSHVLMLHRLRA